jgi:hypothetical protein
MYTDYSPVKRIRSDLRSVFSLTIVSLFLLFLASSAPHRVHHIFENLAGPGKNAPERDGSTEPLITTDAHVGVSHAPANTANQEKKHGESAKPDCVAASVAQNSHLSPVEVSTIALPTTDVICRSSHPSLSFAGFNPSPFAQRAPPHL